MFVCLGRCVYIGACVRMQVSNRFHYHAGHEQPFGTGARCPGCAVVGRQAEGSPVGQPTQQGSQIAAHGDHVSA